MSNEIKTQSDIKAEMELCWLNYTDEVNALAKQAFETHVKPFCQKHGYEFKATTIIAQWYIGEPGCDRTKAALWSRQPRANPELRQLYNLLQISVPGMHVSLGVIMPEFKPAQESSEAKS